MQGISDIKFKLCLHISMHNNVPNPYCYYLYFLLISIYFYLEMQFVINGQQANTRNDRWFDEAEKLMFIYSRYVMFSCMLVARYTFIFSDIWQNLYWISSTQHYLNHSWPLFISPRGITKPQEPNLTRTHTYIHIKSCTKKMKIVEHYRPVFFRILLQTQGQSSYVSCANSF